MVTEKVVIIGGGPAGIAAALELKRQGFDPVIFEKERLGGLLVNANRVDNYPGFPEGIDGVTLVESFVRQARRSDVRVVIDEVTGLEYQQHELRLTTKQRTISAEHVIVASGTKPKTLENMAASVSAAKMIFHAVFPILSASGKTIVILGAGDAAFDYALSLAKHNKVAILNRSDEFVCAPHLWEEVSSHEAITYYQNVNVIAPCEYEDGKLIVRCEGPCDRFSLVADYLLLAIGRTAQVDFVSEELNGQKEALEREGRLFFVGDVKNGDFRQTGIAVGEGIMAAMKIGRRLREAK